MPTKFDVFAAVLEHAPCKAKDIPFRTPVYAHLKALTDMAWLEHKGGKYRPIKNKETSAAFSIIRYCLKNGLDHNLFFTKKAAFALSQLFMNAPDLRPESLKGNQDHTRLLRYLEKNQFMLITDKRPRRGLILKHQLLDNVLSLNDLDQTAHTTPYIDVHQALLKVNVRDNPLEDSFYSFLSGSAQLEGATITPGETKGIILNDIYPDKPAKDIQMVKNLNEAMRYIFEHLEENITPNAIMEINRLVMFSLHRNAGRYKITQNRIQGNPRFRTAAPHEVPRLMEAYCRTLRSIKDKEQCLAALGLAHNELQRIHPFSDGNSRTVRAVVNWLLMRHNLPMLVMRPGSFDEYMRLTKLSDRRDDVKLNGLFHHILRHEGLMGKT